MAEVIEVDIRANTQQATNNVNKFSESIEGASKSTNNLEESIDKATGGMVSGFKNALTGVKGLTAGFKGLRGAIAATGIGALVIAVTAAVEWFTNFEAGVKLADTAMNAFNAVVGQLGKALSSLINLDFEQFTEDIKGIGQAVKDSADATNAQFQAEEKLFALRQKNIVQNEKYRQELELQKKILEDTTLSTEDRLAALDKVTELSEKIQQNAIEETKLEKDRLEALKANENNYQARRDLELELQQTQAELINQEGQLNIIRKDAARVEREILRQVREEKNAQLAEEVRLQKELNELLKVDEEEIDITGLDALDAQFDAEFQKEEEQRQKRLEADEWFYAKEEELQKEYTETERKEAEKRQMIAKAEADAKMQIQAAVNGALTAAASLLGEATAQGKAVAIAQLLFSQGAALAAALRNSQSPTPDNLASGGLAGIAKFATISASILTTAAQAKRIINSAPTIPSVQGQGGGSFAGGGSGAVGSFSQFQGANTPVISAIPNFDPNQQPPIGGNNNGIRAYVVENDITSSQSRQKILERKSRL